MAITAVVVKIFPNKKTTPSGKLADAELHLNDGILHGFCLCGFTIWGKHGEATNVTFPDRAYTTGHGEKRKYLLLRLQKGAPQSRVEDLSTVILNAYREQFTTKV